MFIVKHIDHLVLRVIDIEAMMDFYTDTLGCTLEKIQERVGLFQLRAGNSLIDLIPLSGKLGREGGAAPGREGRNLDHFCLRVEPFDADDMLDYLRGRGLDPGQVESRYGAEGKAHPSM